MELRKDASEKAELIGRKPGGGSMRRRWEYEEEVAV